MRWTPLALVLAVTISATIGSAGIIVHEDLRLTTAWAEVSSGSVHRAVGPYYDSYDHPWQNGHIISGAFASWEGATASNQAYDFSTNSPGGRIESRGHAVGHSVTNDNPDDAQSAYGFAEIHYELLIELTTDALATYDAWASDNASVGVYTESGDVVFSGTGVFSQNLAAGRYRILANASIYTESVQQGGTTNDVSDYRFLLTVPSPGAAACGLVAPLLLVRRRR